MKVSRVLLCGRGHMEATVSGSKVRASDLPLTFECPRRPLADNSTSSSAPSNRGTPTPLIGNAAAGATHPKCPLSWDPSGAKTLNTEVTTQQT